MRQFHILVLFVFSQIESICGQEWIKKIGIDAASKLSSVLHDDNHTNIVLLENDQSSDTVINMASHIMSNTTAAMTIRYLPIR